MSFQTELAKLQRRRSVYLKFAQEDNQTVAWLGETTRLFGKDFDPRGPIPIKGTLVQFGQMARAVTNVDFPMEIPSITPELIDEDNEWRIIGAPPSHRLLYRWIHFILRVLGDDDTIYDQRVGVGQIIEPKFPAQKRVTLGCQLTPGEFLGSQLPRRVFSQADFQRIAPESVNLPVPFVYGIYSNAGLSTVSPTTSPPVTSAPSGQILWEDDFEGYGGDLNALAAAYDWESTFMEFRPGEGINGSVAVSSDATYFGLRKSTIPGFLGADEIGVTWWVKTSAVLTGIPFFYVAHGSVNAEIELDRVIGLPNDLHVSVDQNLQLNQNLSNVLTPGTWQKIDVRWIYGPGGALSIYIDDLPVLQATGLNMSADETLLFVGANDLVDSLQVRNSFLPIDGAPVTPPLPAPQTCATDPGISTNIAGGALRGILVDTGAIPTVSSPNAVVTAYPQDTSIPPPQGVNATDVATGIVGFPVGISTPAAAIRGGKIGTIGNLAGLNHTDINAVSVQGDAPADSLGADSYIVWVWQGGWFDPFNPPAGAPQIRYKVVAPGSGGQWGGDFSAVFTSAADGEVWAPTTVESPVPFTGPRYAFAGHTLRTIPQVFVLKPDPTLADDDPNKNTPVQILQVDGTDYTQEVIEVNGNRYHTIVFASAQQDPTTCTPYEVTANVEGADTNGDGTGLLITDGIDVVLHILLNWVFNSYRSSVGPYAPAGGKWFTDVRYSPGLIDVASFLAAKAVSAARIPGAYKGAGAQVDFIEARQLVWELMTSLDLDFYFDNNVGNGAWSVTMFDPASIVRAALPQYTPSTKIFEETFASGFDQTAHANVLPYFAGRMSGRLLGQSTTQSGGYTVSGQIPDPESIGDYGEIIAQPLYLNWTNDPLTAYDVAFHRIKLIRFPPILATATVPIGTLNDRLASAVAVTHPDGIGSVNGWTQRVCRIFRSDPDFDQITANVLLRDVDALVP